MTVVSPLDLREAMTNVAVANTPVFLARRLRESSALQRAHTIHGTEKLFNALQSLVKKTPENLEQVTETYFYIVAMSLDADLSWLRKARALGFQNIKWTGEIIDYLIANARATVIKEVSIPPRIIIGSQNHDSTSNITKIVRLSP